MKRTLYSVLCAGFVAIFFATARGQDASPLFPAIDGWKLTVEETVYRPENLWDAIDGAADLFLEYSFVDLHIGRYLRGSDLEIKVELYRHATAADAFGIYSQERYPDYHFIELGVQGYAEKGVLNFLGGVYYVKLSSVQSGKEVDDGMLAIAQMVEAHLKQPRSWPSLLRALPELGKKTQSEQYIARSFLGYSFLNGAFVASYDDGAPFKAFIILAETRNEANGILAAYQKSIPKDAIISSEGGFFEVRDPHSGRIELLCRDNVLCGVMSAEDTKRHKELLLAIYNNAMAAK